LIEISRFENGITIKGHAGYAPLGQDIVCAAVSSAVRTLITSIETLTEDAIQCDISPGRVEIRYGKLSSNATLLIASFFIGVEMLAEEYPDNVKIAPAWKA
jgi:uncharacterized protein YsxB (DUF464 family)